MTYSLSLLEKWAYIMVILVCFTILLTFFSYLFCFFMILRRKLLNNRQTETSDHSLDYLDMICCNSSADTNRLFKHSEEHRTNLSADEHFQSEVIETNKKKPVKLKPITQHSQQTIPFLRKFSLNYLPHSENDENQESTNDTNYVPKFLTNFKEIFNSFSGNSQSQPIVTADSAANAANIDDLSHIKTVVIPARLNSSNSSSSDEEADEKPIKKSSFRRASAIKLNRKSRAIRNSSLPTARAHVKFNPNTKLGSGDEESCTSDDYPSSLITHKKSVSSQDSRKNSSGSSYYQSSIVDLYKQQRLSNGSIFTTTSDVRKLSINQINPFEAFGVKLVTMETQDKLGSGYLNNDKPRKASAYSVIAPGSKMDALTMRRFSIMTTSEDVSDKFWVPPQIAAQKQRSSLPDSTALSFKQQNDMALNKSSNYFIFFFYILSYLIFLSSINLHD